MSVLVPAKFPSLSAVFMAAAASVLLLFVARILFLFMRIWSCPMIRPEPQEKEHPLRPLSFISNPWGRSLQWNVLPVSLPFTLTLPEKPSPESGNGVGVGLVQKRAQMLPVMNWYPRTAPRFQPPRELFLRFLSYPAFEHRGRQHLPSTKALCHYQWQRSSCPDTCVYFFPPRRRKPLLFT